MFLCTCVNVCIYVYGEIVMNGYDKLSMDMTMVLCMGKVYGTDCMGKLYIKFLCENVNMYLQFVCVHICMI